MANRQNVSWLSVLLLGLSLLIMVPQEAHGAAELPPIGSSKMAVDTDPATVDDAPSDAEAAATAGSILDLIWDLLNSVEGLVQSAIARAGEARDRALEARDSVNEIRDRVRQGAEALTGQVLSTLSDAVQEVQNTIQQELDGVGDFLADGGPAEPFRQDLIMLLQKIEIIMNALYDIAGLDMKFSLARPIGIIENLPRPILFPLHRFLATGSNFFDSGIVQRLDELADSLSLMRDLVVEGDDSRGPDPYTLCLDAETDDRFCNEILLREAYGATCRLFLGDPPNTERISVVKTVSGVVTTSATGLKLIAKGLIAIGATGLADAEKKIGIHGYIGIHLKNNFPKQLGSFLDGVADATLHVPSYVSSKLKHCQAMYVQNELYRRGVALMIEQEKAAVQTDAVLANQELVLDNQKEILLRQDAILEVLRHSTFGSH